MAVDAWLRSLEARDDETAIAARGEGEPSESRPLMVFGPPPDAVVLSFRNGLPWHTGLARFAPSLEEVAPLSDVQRRALEVAIAALGHPYDAVAPSPRTPGGWGLTVLQGSALVEALARWRANEPSAFATLLRTSGIDLAAAGDKGPVLAFAGAKDSLLAEDAERALFSDPNAVAALVRAGRRPGAQRAQRETVASRFSGEALGVLLPDGAPLGQLLVDWPSLLLLALAWVALGPSGAQRLADLLGSDGPTDPAERALGFADRLCADEERPTAEKLLQNFFYWASPPTGSDDQGARGR